MENNNESPKPRFIAMNRFYYRIKNSITIAWWAFQNPDTLHTSNFKMLSSLLELILKVATENRHMMTHIAYAYPDGEQKQIVSIWAGAGIGAEPTKRISELLAENAMLKAKLSKYVASEISHNADTKPKDDGE